MYVTFSVSNVGISSRCLSNHLRVAAKGRPSLSTPSKIKYAEYPFNGSKDMATADVVFEANDCTQFLLHETILSVASPVFREYFSGKEDKSRTDSKLPGMRIFSLNESGDVLDHLFRMIYPIEKRTISQISLALDVWEAARRYEVTVTEKALAVRVQAMLGPSNELSVYAAACRMGDESLALKAAEAWVKRTFDNNKRHSKYCFFDCISGVNFAYVSRMATCTAGEYHRLLLHILGCIDSRSVFFSGTAKNKGPLINPPNPKLPPESAKPKMNLPTSQTESEKEPGLPCPDVIIRSNDGCDVYTHKVLLQLGGAASLMSEQPLSHPNTATAQLPVHPTSLSTPVLQQLIALSYPSTTYDVFYVRLSEIAPLVAATRMPEYKLAKYEEMLKDRLSGLTRKKPIQAYFVAEQLGWEDIAEEAARQTIAHDIHQLYIPEMEEFSAAAYHKLIRFRQRCQLAVLRTDPDYKPSENSALKPVRLSVLSLLGMKAPLGSIPVALARHLQPNLRQGPIPADASGVKTSGALRPNWRDVVERSVADMSKEARVRERAIELALDAVGVWYHTICRQVLTYVKQVHLENKTQDEVNEAKK